MASLDSEVNLKPKIKKSGYGSFSAVEKILFFVAICGLLVCVTLLACIGLMIAHSAACNKTSTDDKLQRREIPESNIIVTSSEGLIEDKAASYNACHTICTTQVCQDEAIFFLKNIDQEIDPCDNFYQFACGNFVKNSVIPDDTNKITMLSITQKKVINELIDEIKKEVNQNELTAFKELKIYYQNCMNESRIEEEGISIFLKLLNQMGGWPVLLGDKWKDDEFDWRETVFKIMDSDFMVYFPAEFDIEIDPKNTTNYIIVVSDAKTRLNDAFFLDGANNTILKAYYDYMVDIAVMFGADKDTAAREMKQCLYFEINLFNIQMPMEQLINSTINYNPITIKELTQKYSSIPWLAMLNKVLNSSGITVQDDEVVIVFDLKFFTEVESLIARTPKRVLANYLLWAVGGVKERKARSYMCIQDVMSTFPISLSALYVRKYFNKDLQQGVLELVKDVKHQFGKMLEEVDWMDNKTKKAAVEKLHAMDVFVGYADELFDDQKINDYYKDVEINYGSYLESAFNITLFSAKRYYERLRKPVNKKDWTANKNAAVINAYYYRHKNTFEIPAGFLRGSFFHLERPKYLNYGAIGSIIGHEITHGFDSEGRKNDRSGKRVDWWQEDTKEKYFVKARCIIDQYSNYTVQEIGHKLNGNLSQSENIADNGGYKVAYYAYDEWLRRLDAVEPCLPGLDYTARQMFWISAASTWCSKQKVEQLKLTIPGDSHSPPEARVIIPFSNIREFSNDFGCKIGSRMNPVDKCVVWTLVKIKFFIFLSVLLLNIEQRKFVSAQNETDNNNASIEGTCSTVCSSAICNEEASFFLSNMDQNIDPCEDFYQFVCGNFINNTEIPQDEVEISTLGIIRNKLKKDVLSEIKKKVSPADMYAYRKSKIYYQNCINESYIEVEGVKPYLEILEKLGGWPVLLGDNWKENNYSWENTLDKISEIGFRTSFPFVLFIGEDSKNETRNIIHIYPSFTKISDSYFLKENKTLNDYFDYIVDIAVELGANKDIAVTQVKECIEFETKLYKIRTPFEETKNDTNSTNEGQMTLGDLSQKFDGIPWLNLLNQILNPVGEYVNETDTVEIGDLKYFSELKNLLDNTPKRALANYQIWHLLSRIVYYMPDKISDKELIFLNKTHDGLMHKSHRETRCFYEVVGQFSIAVSSMYVKKYFNNDIIRNVTDLAYSVKYQLENRLESVDWMDDETRKAALEKLDAMGIFIGYPNILLNDRVVNEYYKNFQIRFGSYINSVISTMAAIRNRSYKTLRKPVINSRWLFRSAVIVNAYYTFTKNSVVIPAGILRDSVFKFERPEYLNYGAIGSIVGHEITHGFDSNGREYDKKGNHTNWWNPSTEEKFLKRTKCLVEKYNNYTISEAGLPVNGNLTLNENIADIGGVKWAYRAYNKWASQNKIKESCLPGLNYTAQQMFWISAASLWCGKAKIDILKKEIEKNTHSPAKARVVVTFSNIDEFAKDFSCKAGTPMNPEEKCDLW